VQHAPGHGRGELRVDRIEDDVRGHDDCDAGVDRRPKGGQLDPLEPLDRVWQARELEVAVLRRVAVPREVLPAGGHAVLLQPADQGRAHFRHQVTGRAERAVADDGVVRVGVDVERRGEVHVEVDRAKLPGEHAAGGVRELDVARQAQGSHRRHVREPVAQAADPPALLIDAREKGASGPLLELACELGHLLGGLDVAREQNDRRHAAVDQPWELGRGGQAVETDGEHARNRRGQLGHAPKANGSGIPRQLRPERGVMCGSTMADGRWRAIKTCRCRGDLAPSSIVRLPFWSSLRRYPFTAPLASPDTKSRWRTKNRTPTGRIDSSVPAISTP
jgi:hypothetical protein